MLPEISIVLPVFNGQTYLAETLASVAAQTHARAELIVIDDGSTDGSAALVAALCAQSSSPILRNLQLIRQDNQGVAAARNRGVSAARGAWIAFLDQDDLWLPQKLSAQAQQVAEHSDAAWHHCAFTRFYADGREVCKDNGSNDQRETLRRLVDGTLFIPPAAAMVKRAAVAEAGGFDSSVVPSDDWDFFLKLALRHAPLYYGRCLTRFRSHAGSTAKAQQRRIYDAQVRVLERHAPALAGMVPARALAYRRSTIEWHLGRDEERAGNRGAARSHYRAALRAQPLRAKLWTAWLKAMM